jgi:hypothetical protein
VAAPFMKARKLEEREGRRGRRRKMIYIYSMI